MALGQGAQPRRHDVGDVPGEPALTLDGLDQHGRHVLLADPDVRAGLWVAPRSLDRTPR